MKLSKLINELVKIRNESKQDVQVVVWSKVENEYRPVISCIPEGDRIYLDAVLIE